MVLKLQCFNLSSSCSISEPHLWPGLRRTSYALQQYSVNRKTSLSLRPVDHKLLAPAFAYTCTGLATCKFTVRSEKRKVVELPFGYWISFFRYTRISPVQGTMYWVASLRHIGRQANTPQGSFCTPADRCTAVYCCIRKGCTFCCERLCDTGLLLAASASLTNIAVRKQIFPMGILTGSS